MCWWKHVFVYAPNGVCIVLAVMRCVPARVQSMRPWNVPFGTAVIAASFASFTTRSMPFIAEAGVGSAHW